MNRSSKHLARLSLIMMGIGFLATLPFQDSLFGRLLQGGFEAGIVGGLADWFAVTALFRHPLGLPIPHTALLPKNRDRMTGALVSALENNWLTKESIQEKIKQIEITRRVLAFVRGGLYSEPAKKGIESTLTHLVKEIQIDKLTGTAEKMLKQFAASADLPALIQKAVGLTIEKKYDEKLLDKLISRIDEWLHSNNRSEELGGTALRALDQMEFDGFLQFAVKSFQSVMSEEKLGNIIQSLLAGGIDSLKQENNLNRKALLLYIRRELQGLTENEKLLAELDEFKMKQTAEWELGPFLTSQLEAARQRLLDKIQDRTLLNEFLLPYAENTISTLEGDSERVQKIEDFVQGQIARVIQENHKKIGKLVQENLDKLDNEALIEIMESNIGKDLQWIRVNGAVCGFIIGIIITVLKILIG
ncbi:DUF445 domain-containing protein [Peribacillus sp. SCS-37]|uniref:DUF445 domain-containing protein n=1 Tax=Paraperibacillus esterisolvens TaxID=3115296 RepID=UPI003906279D